MRTVTAAGHGDCVLTHLAMLQHNLPAVNLVAPRRGPDALGDQIAAPCPLFVAALFPLRLMMGSLLRPEHAGRSSNGGNGRHGGSRGDRRS